MNYDIGNIQKLVDKAEKLHEQSELLVNELEKEVTYKKKCSRIQNNYQIGNKRYENA